MPSAYLLLTATDQGQVYVLVAHKHNHMPNNGGQHVFPGGRVNPGESLRVAASREFREETGVDYHSLEKRFDLGDQGACDASHASTMDLQTHGILFVDVSYADLIRIGDLINDNIAQHHVADEELQRVDVMTKGAALAVIQQDDNPANLARRTNWFSDAIGEL